MATAQNSQRRKPTIAEVDAVLTAPGQLHELTEAVVNGRKMKVFKNVPPSLKFVWLYNLSRFASREYLVLGKERYTYGQIHQRTVAMANMFAKEYGCKKGDKVAIVMRNLPEWVTAFWACHLMGCVAVAVNAWLPADALVKCLDRSDSVVALVDPQRGRQYAKEINALKKTAVKAVLVVRDDNPPKGLVSFNKIIKKYANEKEAPQAEIEADDPATIFFTSGTTSFPKAVLSSQRGFIHGFFCSSIVARRAALRRGDPVAEIGPEDPQVVMLLPTPFFHVTGTTSLLQTITMIGGKAVLLHKWDPKEAARLVEREKVNVVGGIPFMMQDLIEHGTAEQLATLEGISYGGAPSSDVLPKLLSKSAPKSAIAQAYGLSETNAVIVGHCDEDYFEKPLSTGVTVPTVELKIVGEGDREMPVRGVGEIWARGPSIFNGYYNDEKATKEAITPDGWFKTGDVGYLDEDGWLFISDRAKDIIIRGGENIAAASVEKALLRNPKVHDAAVMGVSDKKLGELPAAIVIVQPNAKNTTEAEIIEDVKQYIPKHETPVMVMVRVPKSDTESELWLERNANGKLVKTELKKVVEQEWQRRNKSKL